MDQGRKYTGVNIPTISKTTLYVGLKKDDLNLSHFLEQWLTLGCAVGCSEKSKMQNRIMAKTTFWILTFSSFGGGCLIISPTPLKVRKKLFWL